MDEDDRIEAAFHRSSVSRPCTLGRPGATVLDLYIMRMRLRTVCDSQRGVASPAPSDRAFNVPEFKEKKLQPQRQGSTKPAMNAAGRRAKIIEKTKTQWC
jgi:hypothetical protein